MPKWRKKRGLLIQSHPNPLIADGHDNLVILLAHLEPDFTARWRLLQGVGAEVGPHVIQPESIPSSGRRSVKHMSDDEDEGNETWFGYHVRVARRTPVIRTTGGQSWGTRKAILGTNRGRMPGRIREKAGSATKHARASRCAR